MASTAEASPARPGVTTAGFAVALGHLLLWAALDAMPFQDLPNHVARAVVIGDLVFDGGARFGQWFRFEWQAIPYVLGDALLVPLVRLLPADVAARVWTALAWVALPAALYVLLRTWRCPPFVIATSLVLALYLATDTFFVLGFANFRLAVALVLLGVAAWERLQAAPDRAGRWAAFLAAALAGYLMHLSALVFLIAAVGTLGALRLAGRRARLFPLLAAGVPLLLLFAWHVLVREPPDPALDVYPDAGRKLLRLASSLVRFRTPLEIAVFLGFSVALALPILLAARRIPARAVELLALAVAFFAVYLVLPEQKGAVWSVDNRSLALAWLWLAVAAATAADVGRFRGAFAAATVAVAAVNLAVLAVSLLPANAKMREFRALAREVPRGAVLLPVLTLPRHGGTNPFVHAACFATLEADAVNPYLFSGDENLPMRYFRFRHRPRAPWPFWYQYDLPPRSWHGIAEEYDYLFVSLPADWSRIPLRAEIVAENGTAALARLVDGRGQRTASHADR